MTFDVPPTGFSISAPRNTDLPFTEDVEYHEGADSTLRRVMHLLVTGKGVLATVTLQELRKRRSISQDELAKVMRVRQASVSQTEQRDDISISTLRAVVGALGGRLVVKALFDHGAVEIKVDNRERVAIARSDLFDRAAQCGCRPHPAVTCKLRSGRRSDLCAGTARSRGSHRSKSSRIDREGLVLSRWRSTAYAIRGMKGIWEAAMAEGTIKRLTDKGFGFIDNGTGKDLFFHTSAVEGCRFEDLREGQKVTYNVGHGTKGPRAENVRAV